jgi:uncharacterized protein
LKLRQETKYPESDRTTLTITAARGAVPVNLRIPGWLATAPTVRINGRALEVSAAPGSYLTLNHAWKAGDKIELEMPMQLRVEAMPDDATLQAFLYGPVVLAGDLGTEGLTPQQIVGPNAPRLGTGNPNAPQPPNAPPRVPPIDVPAFKASGDPAAWIKPAGAPLTFRTSGQAKDLTLAPLNSIFDRRYSVYWKVTS